MKLQFKAVLTFCLAINIPVFAQIVTKQDTLKELLRRVEILTEEIEKVKLGDIAEPDYKSQFGMGPAASKVYQLKKTGVSIAGYGEMVYENYSEETSSGTPSGQTNQIDFLRHIAYFGFRFNNWLIFNSEIEFEHANEVAVEFGYIEAQIKPALNVRAGMLLIPVGIMNELHEPPTFHGSLRPESERQVIPSTWRANGFGIAGMTTNGFNYKLYLTESLNAENFSSNGIRNGRQNGSQAVAEDLAITGRVNYTGVPGLDFGGSFFFGNTGQSLIDSTGVDVDAPLRLLSLHAMFTRHGLELRGLYAYSKIDDAARLNGALGLTGSSSIGNSQSGFYLTVAYDVLPRLIQGTSHYLAPFVQYEKLNTQNSVPTGFSKNPARERTNVTLGLTYKPHPNVAFKIDYINKSNEADSAVDQFNLALNYLF